MYANTWVARYCERWLFSVTGVSQSSPVLIVLQTCFSHPLTITSSEKNILFQYWEYLDIRARTAEETHIDGRGFG